MDNERSKKKPTSLEFVEEELKEFSKRISKIEEKVSEIEDKTRKSFQKYVDYFDLLSVVGTTDMLIMTKILGQMSLSSGNISLFDAIIDHIKDKEMKLLQGGEKGIALYHVSSSSQIMMLLSRAKTWNISFEQISSYLIFKLGKKLAREIVEKANIVEYYGKESLPIWEKLLEE